MNEAEARFAEYEKRAKEIRKYRIRKLPWSRRWMYTTIGDIFQLLTQIYRR